MSKTPDIPSSQRPAKYRAFVEELKKSVADSQSKSRPRNDKKSARTTPRDVLSPKKR